MKRIHLTVACTLVLVFFVLEGCDNSEKKKAQAEEQKTKDGLRVDPGAYTPKPLDTSMGTPTPTPGKRSDLQ